MKLLSKIRVLAVIFTLFFMAKLQAMLVESPCEKHEQISKELFYLKLCEKLEALPGSEVGRGHLGKVVNASPMPGSPAEHNDELAAAVRKIPLSDSDLTWEGKYQEAIRTALKDQFCDLFYRHIPKVASVSPDCIKMEKISGNTLEATIKTMALTPFLIFMKHLIAFVDALHEVGYAHGDLCPSNIILDLNNLAVFSVIDYELSGVIGVDYQKMSGAAGYSAPEMRQENLVGTKGDIYSLGMILKTYFNCYSEADEIHELINMMIIKNHEQRTITLKKVFVDLNNIIMSVNQKILDYKPINNSNLGKPIVGYEGFSSK